MIGVDVETEHDLPEVTQPNPGLPSRLLPPGTELGPLLLPAVCGDFRLSVPEIEPAEDLAARSVVLTIGQVRPVANRITWVCAGGKE